MKIYKNMQAAAKADAVSPERESRKLICRKMNAADVVDVARLEQELFPDPWSAVSIGESGKLPDADCTVVESEGEVVGYYIFYRSFDEGELIRIGVAKSGQRRGVGRFLMQCMEQCCREKDVRRILLDVREQNQAARSFYRSQGFVEDGIRRNFYSGPTEDAVLMSRELNVLK
ncbi:ribosomal protein S18-alanine N-acetyltransferase [Hespellia stercorisuis]|uniref:Ribosomal-protein-alanine N-acetyltransferase n=1 Tax=Hespellia stercorisuis DSM 15480 TaxID=1121950 RepID=A0A1M6UKW0_9FIRM|nr:ribosomal protein S18-alanine N-acetyltransferase [Hespellia stercorisuis]SHK69817.1 ribosomal-protein-alanine N-acetyltransferase [Hespellia stercorisuis DSM 15480]